MLTAIKNLRRPYLRALRWALGLGIVSAASGCGSIESYIDAGRGEGPGVRPYSGISHDAQVIYQGSESGDYTRIFFYSIDVPLSFCLDTVALPVTIPIWAASGD